MSDDLEERTEAFLNSMLIHARDKDIPEAAKELIAMFKQDAVEAVKDKVDSLGWVDIDVAIEAINQL